MKAAKLKTHSKGPGRDEILKTYIWDVCKVKVNTLNDEPLYSQSLAEDWSILSMENHQPERKDLPVIDTWDPPMNWSSPYPKQGLKKDP